MHPQLCTLQVWGCFPLFFLDTTILDPASFFFFVLYLVFMGGILDDRQCNIHQIPVFMILPGVCVNMCCMCGRGGMRLRIFTYVCACVPLILSVISQVSTCTRFHLIYTQWGNLLTKHMPLHKSVSTFHCVPNSFSVLQSKLFETRGEMTLNNIIAVPWRTKFMLPVMFAVKRNSIH